MVKRFFSAGLLAVVLTLAYPLGTGHWMRHRLEKEFGFRLEGQLRPVFLETALQLTDVRFVWPERVKVESGDFRVEYPFFPFLAETLKLSIRGENLKVELLGEWQAMYGVQTTEIQRLNAVLRIRRAKIDQIDRLEVDSPMIKLNIHKTV